MDSLSYSVGVLVAQNLQQQGIDKVDPESLADAINDVMEGNDLKISQQDAAMNFQNHMAKKQEAAAADNVEAGKKFLEENAKREEVTTTASGLQYEVLEAGDGKSPEATDQVTVHYEGRLLSGKVFDSSIERGQPATFGLNQVIKGWTEGVQLMKEGSKYRFYIPSELAYGARGAGADIGPNATLIFDVQLIEVK
ncbi:MAG: FKBP-type peptidyl-prolyl cis-trans isomerase [Bacteroidetes bacterium]|nr:FKBP-type peptidyl-prolyl cis-trans isomerase [Bacteroidota bacterium]